MFLKRFENILGVFINRNDKLFRNNFKLFIICPIIWTWFIFIFIFFCIISSQINPLALASPTSQISRSSLWNMWISSWFFRWNIFIIFLRSILTFFRFIIFFRLFNYILKSPMWKSVSISLKSLSLFFIIVFPFIILFLFIFAHIFWNPSLLSSSLISVSSSIWIHFKFYL